MSVFAKWSEGELETFESNDWEINGDYEWMGILMMGCIFEKEWTMVELVESLKADMKVLSGDEICEKYRKHKKVTV
jgi:hypothetical protein